MLTGSCYCGADTLPAAIHMRRNGVPKAAFATRKVSRRVFAQRHS